LRSLRVRVGVTRLRLDVISRATLADLKLLMTDRDSIEVWEAPGVHYVDASAVLHDCGGSYDGSEQTRNKTCKFSPESEQRGRHNQFLRPISSISA
jgi:hypothetical protein